MESTLIDLTFLSYFLSGRQVHAANGKCVLRRRLRTTKTSLSEKAGTWGGQEFGVATPFDSARMIGVASPIGDASTICTQLASAVPQRHSNHRNGVGLAATLLRRIAERFETVEWRCMRAVCCKSANLIA